VAKIVSNDSPPTNEQFLNFELRISDGSNLYENRCGILARRIVKGKGRDAVSDDLLTICGHRYD
jgi:hypothetical protein